MADMKSTYQKASDAKHINGKVVYLSYYASMSIDKSISKTLSQSQKPVKK